MNTCLNCKYEPEWGEESKGEYKRRFGNCKWTAKIPTLPSCMWINRKGITWFTKDNSGVYDHCPTWEAKP